MLKIYLTLQIMTQIDHCLKSKKDKPVTEFMKDKLGGKIMTEFVRLRAETSGYIIEDGSEDKKAKDTKKCLIKIKIKFENCKNCLEANQLKNKINHLEKNKIDSFITKENKKNL